MGGDWTPANNPPTPPRAAQPAPQAAPAAPAPAEHNPEGRDLEDLPF